MRELSLACESESWMAPQCPYPTHRHLLQHLVRPRFVSRLCDFHEGSNRSESTNRLYCRREGITKITNSPVVSCYIGLDKQASEEREESDPQRRLSEGVFIFSEVRFQSRQHAKSRQSDEDSNDDLYVPPYAMRIRPHRSKVFSLW